MIGNDVTQRVYVRSSALLLLLPTQGTPWAPWMPLVSSCARDESCRRRARRARRRAVLCYMTCSPTLWWRRRKSSSGGRSVPLLLLSIRVTPWAPWVPLMSSGAGDESRGRLTRRAWRRSILRNVTCSSFRCRRKSGGGGWCGRRPPCRSALAWIEVHIVVDNVGIGTRRWSCILSRGRRRQRRRRRRRRQRWRPGKGR